MANPRRFEPDELLVRPGTYFNSQTEVLLIVDDTAVVDTEMLTTDDRSAAEWVLVSDEIPVEEHERDALIEAFQHQYAEDGASADDDEDDETEDELEPDEEPSELE